MNIIQYKKGNEQLTKDVWVKAGDITSHDSSTKRISKQYIIKKLFRFYVQIIRTDLGFIPWKKIVEKTSVRFRLKAMTEREEKFSVRGE